ncbi:OprO/OprP family phosphate-selective porin [Lutibacter maritimus]|uniref:Phosphate-selective porin OprO and OprP n=1 Tax=Lutibacter maritimus TaxID=593133 RepID=A0A1I6RIX7_9FLAO|nr:porin [Lutibacter maritimus]SFS64596.1 phosphate-selective porin OprO and OprP [Lutibacter maritimus]
MKNKFYTLLVVMILYGIGSVAQEGTKTDSIRINQYGQAVRFQPLNAEAQDGILKFTSADKSYSIWMDNRVQFDGEMFSNDAFNPIGNGASIRRARFAMKAELWNNWYGEIDLDFSGSAVELKDAYVKYTPDSDSWNIKAGHFKESFGMETTTTSRYLTFTERSLMSKFDPSRHLGFQFNHWADKYLITAGLHFSTVGDNEEVVFTQDNNKDLGVDDGYSLTGRAVFIPINDEDKVLHLGIAGTYRTPKVDLEIPYSYRFSTRSHSSINRKKYIDTDDILNVDNNTMVNFELAGRYKGFMFQSEYKLVTVNRNDDLDAINFNGFYVQGAYLLFGGHHNYNAEEGEFTRITRGKEYGDLELAVRYDFVDANDFDNGIYGGSAEGYTVGLNYHVNPNVKFMLNYIYNNNDRFANGKGKLYAGYDADGNLTKDPTNVFDADGNGGDDFGMAAFRIEIDF